jgi:hypothetical protein
MNPFRGKPPEPPPREGQSIRLRDLSIVTLVALASDRFGLPAVDGDARTPGGLPLSENPDEAAAAEWSAAVVAKHKWMFESHVRLNGLTATMVAPLIRQAFEGDEAAASKVTRVVGGLGL